MAFPPGVTIKDYQSDVSQGYPNPKPGGQPARFPTIIQIVPVTEKRRMRGLRPGTEDRHGSVFIGDPSASSSAPVESSRRTSLPSSANSADVSSMPFVCA